MIRMKVKCISREETMGSRYDNDLKAHVPAALFGYRFAFVTGADSEENAQYWAATPSGTFIVSTVLQDVFQLGAYYYIDATPADGEGRVYS